VSPPFGPELANPVHPEVLAMAEINRQREKGIPVWVMLLALIVLALLVWYFLANRNPGRQTAPDNVTVLELRSRAPLRVLGIQQVDRQLAVG
jgi:hypothetical protein